MSAAGSSARSAVSSSVSVEAGSRARPPRSRVEQLAGVHEVAVVADRERPPGPEAERRLGVLPDRRAGRRVAAVGDREAAAQARQAALVEDARDEPEVLVEHELLAVADGQAGRFLAAVLEREEAEGGDRAGRHARAVEARPAGPPRRRRTRQRPSGPWVGAGRRPTSMPSARSRPCSQAWRRSWTATSRASATFDPRPSAAPVAPWPVSSMTQALPADDADLLDRQPELAGQEQQRRRVARPAGQDEAGRALAEQLDRRRAADRQPQPRPEAAPDARPPRGRRRGRRPRRPGPTRRARGRSPPGRSAGRPRSRSRSRAGGPSSGATPARSA